MQWHAPVIPATQEAEAVESFEPGRQRLQWTELMPLHSSMDNRARLCLKKKNQTNLNLKNSFSLLKHVTNSEDQKQDG